MFGYAFCFKSKLNVKKKCRITGIPAEKFNRLDLAKQLYIMGNLNTNKGAHVLLVYNCLLQAFVNFVKAADNS